MFVVAIIGLSGRTPSSVSLRRIALAATRRSGKRTPRAPNRAFLEATFALASSP